jgi:hypothetical protein
MGRGCWSDDSTYTRPLRADTPEPEADPIVDAYQDIRGSKSDVKNLYNHHDDSGKESIWSDRADLVLGKEQLDALAAPYAIVQRLSRSKGSGEWTPHSIEVQSKRLKSLLERVFFGYDD